MDWLRLKRIGAPTVEVVTLEEARAHLRIGHDLDNDYIARLIDVATAFIEGPNGAGIALAPSQWSLTMDHLARHFDIDLCPVQTIDRITLRGVEVTDFSADLDSTPARIHFHGTPTPHHLASVKVEFTAGYDAIPADLRHAILMIVAHLYENREAISATTFNDVPMAVSAILARYRAFG